MQSSFPNFNHFEGGNLPKPLIQLDIPEDYSNGSGFSAVGMEYNSQTKARTIPGNYISGIYCQLGDDMLPTTFYKNLKNRLTGVSAGSLIRQDAAQFTSVLVVNVSAHIP